MTEVTIEEAVRWFLLQNPAVLPYLADAVVVFNWGRGERELEELICIEQYTNTFSDVD